MKTTRRFLTHALLGALLVASLCAAPVAQLPNPFGVFNLRPFNERPAQAQVDLAQRAGYDGLMASTSLRNPIERLREFLTVPAVRDGQFRIYAILWQHNITKGDVDPVRLREVAAVAKDLHASLWVNIVGSPGERPKTLAALATIADHCQTVGVELVLYPHYKCTFETTEQALEIWRTLARPAVKLSIHLCHEYRAGNLDRIDEIVAQAAPHLALASVNGIDTSAPLHVDGWEGLILPLDEGNFDVRPYLAALARHGYRGPILLHNYGFKERPEEYLPDSMKRWREISADVAAQLARSK